MFRQRNNQQEFAQNGMKVLFGIIIVTVLCHIFIQDPKQLLSLSYDGAKFIDPATGYIFKSKGVHQGCYWQFVTAMFRHGNFSHLFFNMFALYIFGSLVAPILGALRFTLLYFISGIFGGILWLLFANPHALSVGASGAVFGVAVACAMLNPNQQFYLLFYPVPIKAKTLIPIYFLIDVLGELLQTTTTFGSRIAHLAHIGGAVAGYFIIKFFFRKRKQFIWDPIKALLSFIKKKTNNQSSSKSWTVKGNTNRPKGWTVSHPSSSKQRKSKTTLSEREINTLLDKISKHGINSLSKEEYDNLKTAREQLKNRRT